MIKPRLNLTRRGRDFRARTEDVETTLQLALLDNAEDLRTTMRDLSPVSEIDHTHMRDTIEVVALGPLTYGITIGNEDNPAEYWVYVNYGTRYMAARPFVETAIDSVGPRAERRMADAVGSKSSRR